ncbi:hypothetical protein DICA0_E38886 [Diutina catenulata]
MPEAHSTAVDSYNVNHKVYDQFRPSFDDKLVEPFLAQAGLASESGNGYQFDTSKVILELAAGTGKFTANLVAHGWADAGNLKVMDPSQGMLDSLSANFPQIGKDNVILGSSYKLPLPDSSVDAVLIAQAFHWFSDETSVAELRRVLKPHGKLGLIWNFEYANESLHTPIAKCQFYNDGVPDFDKLTDPKTHSEAIDVFRDYLSAPWAKQTAEYIYNYDGNVPQYRKGQWRAILEKSDSFKQVFPEQFLLNSNVQTRDEVYGYWASRSFITCLDEAKQQQIHQDLSDILDKTINDDSWIDEAHTKLRKPTGAHTVVFEVEK